MYLECDVRFSRLLCVKAVNWEHRLRSALLLYVPDTHLGYNITHL